jgi:hypothetical protein
VPFAERIRKEAGIASRAVGMITTPAEAEAIVAEGRADLVALARGFLADPRWGLRATAALGGKPELPPQYLRAARLLSPQGLREGDRFRPPGAVPANGRAGLARAGGFWPSLAAPSKASPMSSHDHRDDPAGTPAGHDHAAHAGHAHHDHAGAGLCRP